MPCLVERRDIYAADGSGKGQPEAVEFPFGLRSVPLQREREREAVEFPFGLRFSAAYISISIYLSVYIGAA